MGHFWFERPVNDTLVELIYNLKSTNLAELIQHISEELKAAKEFFTFPGPLVEVNTRIDPVVYVVHFNIVLHKSGTDAEILGSQVV